MLEAQLAIAHRHPAQAFAAAPRIPDDHAIAPQAHLLAGRLWREQHCLRIAEAEFRRALELKPGLIEAHKELVYILGIQARRREVDAEFHALARLTPLSHHDLFTWAEPFHPLEPGYREDLDVHRGRPRGPLQPSCRCRIAAGATGRRGGLVHRADSHDPARDDPDALAFRIEFAFNRGHVAEAERLLARASENQPRTARICGEISLRHHDFDCCDQVFQGSTHREPYDRVRPCTLPRHFSSKETKRRRSVYLDRVERLNTIYSLIIRVRTPNHQNQASDLDSWARRVRQPA